MALDAAHNTPAKVQVTQVGLLATAAKANLNSRVAFDAFPAEHIDIIPLGKP